MSASKHFLALLELQDFLDPSSLMLCCSINHNLLLIDKDESRLEYLAQNLSKSYPSTTLLTLAADITDKSTPDRAISSCRLIHILTFLLIMLVLTSSLRLTL